MATVTNATSSATSITGLKLLGLQPKAKADEPVLLAADNFRANPLASSPAEIDAKLEALRNNQPRQFLKTPVGEIAYVHLKPTNGNGKKIVVHHGGPDHLQSSIDLIIGLYKQGYEVLAFDRPGVGYSKPNEKYDFSLAAQAKLAYEVPRLLGFNEYYVVGHSWGLRCVGEALFKYSSAMNIKGIINVAGEFPAISDVEAPDDGLENLMTTKYPGASFTKIGYVSFAPMILSDMYAKFKGTPEFDKRVEAYLKPLQSDGEVFNLMPNDRKTAELFQFWRTDEALNTYKVEYSSSRADYVGRVLREKNTPYLGIVSDADKAMVSTKGPVDFGKRTFDDVLKLKGTNVNDAFVVIKGAGHFVQQEATDEVLAAIDTFLKKVQ